MKEFSAFLDRKYKNWAHKIGSWKYLIIWRPVVPVFPRAECLVSFLHLNSFQRVWKSAAAAAPYLILVQVDGKCQCVVDIIKIDFTYFFLLFKCKNKFQGYVCGLHYISVGQWCPNVQHGTFPSPLRIRIEYCMHFFPMFLCLACCHLGFMYIHLFFIFWKVFKNSGLLLFLPLFLFLHHNHKY